MSIVSVPNGSTLRCVSSGHVQTNVNIQYGTVCIQQQQQQQHRLQQFKHSIRHVGKQ
jgi:hypothetical protein